MLIEFIGPAGAGKSFLSDRLVSALLESGVRAQHFDLLEIDRLRPRSILLGISALRLAAAVRPAGWAAFTHASGVIARYSIRRAMCHGEEGIYVTSEGLFHRIITLQRRSRSRTVSEIAATLLNSIRPPDIVVAVRASPQKILARRTARQRPGDVFSAETIARDIADVEATVRAVAGMRDRFHPGIALVPVDTDEDGDGPAIERIMAAVREHFDRPFDSQAGEQ